MNKVKKILILLLLSNYSYCQVARVIDGDSTRPTNNGLYKPFMKAGVFKLMPFSGPSVLVRMKTDTQGLSDVNFTTTKDQKLLGIQEGAEVNVNADWDATVGDSKINNKPSTFPPSTHTHTQADVVGLTSILDNKVDKIYGYGLSKNDLTDDLKTKIDGISPGATVNSTDVYLLSRTNHTGTQAQATITGLTSDLANKAFLSVTDNSFNNINTFNLNTIFLGKLSVGVTTAISTAEIYSGSTNTANGLILSQGTGSGNVSSSRLYFSNTGDLTNSFAIRKNGNNLVFSYGATPGSSSGTDGFSLTNGGSTLFNGVIAPATNTTYDNGTTSLRWRYTYTQRLSLTNVVPTAIIHLPGGTSTAGTAPLKFTSGTNLTTPENGSVEYDGTNYFVTTGGIRYKLQMVATAPASATDTGVAGTIAFDATHIYYCVSTDTWVRADLASW